jgi:hypothetical protein
MPRILHYLANHISHNINSVSNLTSILYSLIYLLMERLAVAWLRDTMWLLSTLMCAILYSLRACSFSAKIVALFMSYCGKGVMSYDLCLSFS